MLCYLKFINLWDPPSLCNSVVFNDNFSEKMQTRWKTTCWKIAYRFREFHYPRALIFVSIFFCLQQSANSEVLVNEHFVRLSDRRAHGNNELPSNAETPRLIRFIQSSLRPSGEPLPQEFPVATRQPSIKGCK